MKRIPAGILLEGFQIEGTAKGMHSLASTGGGVMTSSVHHPPPRPLTAIHGARADVSTHGMRVRKGGNIVVVCGPGSDTTGAVVPAALLKYIPRDPK